MNVQHRRHSLVKLLGIVPLQDVHIAEMPFVLLFGFVFSFITIIVLYYVLIQCSKLRSKCVHLSSAEVAKSVHPGFNSCAHRLRYTLYIRENGAHAGCMHSFLKCAPGIKIMHAGCRVHP